MATEESLRTLRDLGLNQLEAEVYVYLLPSPPLTAYAIGRALGRPTANVYKAVESLARLGAVLIEEGEQRVCRAVPMSELAKQLQRGYLSTLDRAVRALAASEASPVDERVYKLESVPHVFERCEAMLERAFEVAVIDAFPRSLERIAPAVIAAAARGVEVFVEAYSPIDLPGARVAIFPNGADTLATWRSEQLNVVVDGREHVLALLTSDLSAIRQALWSNSLYLSCIHHAGRLCEHTLVAMMKADPDEALRLLEEHRFFARSRVPGQRELVERFEWKTRSTSVNERKNSS